MIFVRVNQHRRRRVHLIRNLSLFAIPDASHAHEEEGKKKLHCDKNNINERERNKVHAGLTVGMWKVDFFIWEGDEEEDYIVSNYKGIVGRRIIKHGDPMLNLGLVFYYPEKSQKLQTFFEIIKKNNFKNYFKIIYKGIEIKKI